MKKIAIVARDLSSVSGISMNIINTAKNIPEADIINWGITKQDDNIGDLFNRVTDVSSIRELFKVCNKYDIIHVHGTPQNSLILLYRLLLRKKFKVIMTWHGALPIEYGSNLKMKLKLFITIASDKISRILSDRLICVSQFLADKTRIKCTVIPNGYDPEIFYEFHIPHEKFTAIAVGTYTKFKGSETIDDLIVSFPEINFMLITPTLIDYSHNKILNSKNVTIRSNITSEELNKEYNRSDVFIRPTKFESFGMPIVEAAVCGLPLLVSDIPGFSEKVDKTFALKGFKRALRERDFGTLKGDVTDYQWDKVCKKIKEEYE